MDNLIKYALMVFSHDEWVILLVMLLMVSAITETAKRVFFIRWKPTSKKRALYITALVAGIVFSIGAPWMITGHIRPWFWIVTAISLGPLSNVLHWLTLGIIAWKFPGLASQLKGNTR